MSSQYCGHALRTKLTNLSSSNHTAEDLSIILWDLAAGRQVKTMTGHTSSIYSLSFSAESTVLVSGAADATVRVWDVLAPASGNESALSTTTRGGAGETGKLASIANAKRAAAAAGLAKSNRALMGGADGKDGKIVKLGAGASFGAGASGDKDKKET